jgi:hypothetical protein
MKVTGPNIISAAVRRIEHLLPSMRRRKPALLGGQPVTGVRCRYA